MAIQVFETASEFTNAKGFNVYQNKDQLGSFDMGAIPMLGPALLNITTYPHPGRGKSGLVIGGFRDQMGRGTNFVAPDITHVGSWFAMAKLGLVEEVYDKGTLSVAQARILSVIPIIQILQKGGIKIERLDIERRSNTPLGAILHSLILGNDGTEHFNAVLHARA